MVQETFQSADGSTAKKGEVLPGFEPGSPDSESEVLTSYTIRPFTPPVGLEPTILPLGGVRVIHYATGALTQTTGSGSR